MASYGVPASNASDGDPDEHVFLSGFAEELPLTKLGSRIPIPSQSHMLESEGPEEPYCLPEAIINDVIMPSGEAFHAPVVVSMSSTRGRLKRISSNSTRKGSEIVLGEDMFEIGPSPERGIKPSSNLPRIQPLKKPNQAPSSKHQRKQTRTAPRTNPSDADATSDDVVNSYPTMNRAQFRYGPQQPSNKRQKHNHTTVSDISNQHLGSVDDPHQTTNSSALYPTSEKRQTRSMHQSVVPESDPMQRQHSQYQKSNPSPPLTQDQPLASEDFPCLVPDEQQPISNSFRRNPSRSNQVVEVVIDNTASTRLSKEDANTSSQKTSPPTIAQDNVTVTPPIPSADVVQDQDHVRSVIPADSAASPMVVNDLQSPAVEEDQKSSHEDSMLFKPYSQSTRDAQSQADVLAHDLERVHELHEHCGPGDDSEDYTAEIHGFKDEANSSEDIFMPVELHEALEKAQSIHENAAEIRKEFNGISILKSYGRLKRTVVQWKAAQNHSETGHLVKLSNEITKEAKSILEKSAWNLQKGLDYIYKRVLPTLVRMLYVCMTYYLSEIRTMKKLPYEPLKESSRVVNAILHIYDEALDAGTRYRRPLDVISMIARIKVVSKILIRHRSKLDLAQRLQTQRSRREAIDREELVAQEAVDREEEDELKLREWKHRWNVLHDQRLGAAMEGRVFFSPGQNRHLRQTPLESPDVPPTHWDPDMHVCYLAVGLQDFAGPNVYRDIFRKYCRRGGPLEKFNVAEIVDKAVSLKKAITKLVEEDGEELDQWVKDIFDPRVPPEGLHRMEGC
ncbi:hypothetical protein E4T49_01021 [Aureobasidium sp. EXF-10728]|nr:hypothetical protein E4T49_01021 [Aureobasidium sp. EXF-10728]